MSRRVWIAALAAATVALPASAQAGALPDGGLTVQEVAKWLQDAGYRAQTKKTDDGSDYVASSTDGVNFEVYMYDCVSGRCASVQFGAGFDLDAPITLQEANTWNTQKRYSKVYIGDDNNPYLQYDANLSPGGTWEALDDDFGVWRGMLTAFTEFIDW